MFSVKVDYVQLAMDVARCTNSTLDTYLEGDGVLMVDVINEQGECISYCLDSLDIENWLMTSLEPVLTDRHVAYRTASCY